MEIIIVTERDAANLPFTAPARAVYWQCRRGSERAEVLGYLLVSNQHRLLCALRRNPLTTLIDAAGGAEEPLGTRGQEQCSPKGPSRQGPWGMVKGGQTMAPIVSCSLPGPTTNRLAGISEGYLFFEPHC